MEAKDTVMKGKITSLTLQQQKIVARLLERQAESAFKLGKEEEAKGGHNSISYLEGHKDGKVVGEQVGMMKVVEWAEQFKNPVAHNCIEIPLKTRQVQLKIWFKDNPELLKKWGIE